MDRPILTGGVTTSSSSTLPTPPPLPESLSDMDPSPTSGSFSSPHASSTDPFLAGSALGGGGSPAGSVPPKIHSATVTSPDTTTTTTTTTTVVDIPPSEHFLKAPPERPQLTQMPQGQQHGFQQEPHEMGKHGHQQPLQREPDTIIGQWKAVPGGFTTHPISGGGEPAGSMMGGGMTGAGALGGSSAPTARQQTMMGGDQGIPSIFTGGVGPEVMLGKWKLVRSDNWEEYLKALGVNIIKRNLMDMENYCVHIERVGQETFKMTTSTTMKKIELTFKLDGKEIEEHTDDGRRVLTKMIWEDGKLIQKRFGQDGDKGGTLTRIFKGKDDMELICEVDGVVARRYYKRDQHCM